MLNCYSLEEELTAVETERLKALGAIIPFNNIDKSLNSFFYLDENVKLNASIIPSYKYILLGKVSEAEANKHKSKYSEVSKIKPKDIVLYSYYKKLPMEVISITPDGQKAKLRIKLRHFETSVEVETSKLKLLTNHLEQDAEQVEYSAIPTYKFENQLGGYLIIDCDSINMQDNYYTEYVEALVLAIRIKTSFSDVKVVFANPFKAIEELAKDFGLIVAFGSLYEIINKLHEQIQEDEDNSVSIIVYTEKKYIQALNYVTTLEIENNTIVSHSFNERMQKNYNIQIKRALSKEESLLIAEYIEKYEILSRQVFPPQPPSAFIERINKSDKVNVSEINFKGYNRCKEVSFVDYKDNYKTASIKTKLKLENIGLEYLSHNIEFYSRILKS